MERKNTQLLVAFSEVLRRKRREAGLSQEDLAARAEVSTRHISHLETKRRQPSLTIIAALSQGLGLTMAKFAEEIEEEVRATDAAAGHL